jgi:hypothetical protein
VTLLIFDELFDGGVDFLDLRVDLGEAFLVLLLIALARFLAAVRSDQRGASEMHFLQLSDDLAEAGTRLDIQNGSSFPRLVPRRGGARVFS